MSSLPLYVSDGDNDYFIIRLISTIFSRNSCDEKTQDHFSFKSKKPKTKLLY